MLDRLEMLRSLSVEKNTRMVLLVMDGLGGLPSADGITELEAAATPNLDLLASRGETGLLEMVDVGITPGSGPGHLALFGYDPRKHFIGRGILETLGVGAEVLPGEMCARGNFCTWGEGDIILDRRAGRIDTDSSASLIARLGKSIREIEGVAVRFYPGIEHRFAVVLSGEGLNDSVTDADPQNDGSPMVWSRPLEPLGTRTANVINSLIRRLRETLAGEEKASGCLLRGVSGTPEIPLFPDLYKMRSAAVATYPMYRGLARIVGMEVVDAGKTIESLFQAVKRDWNSFDFFFVHVKYTDSRGEDGDFEAKRDVIEKVDRLLPEILSLKPDVMVVTGDHSTPSVMGGHSWHPSPFLLSSRFVRTDGSESFGERACARGSLGVMPAHKMMGLMLAHAGRLAKYGA
ncbi:MAG: 2,3-bisphosphoglycerate-independent phosphoglycerate mutase [Thermovirgaceae bacterium]|nr:2,3-bisphosphoglycerate-independent phosphoglycerate mutase [Thermovirgaceae bacterium]